MKLKTLSAAILAAALLGFATHPANAQTKTTYTEGDLFVGFRALNGTGSSSNYLIKIGQASQFKNATPGVPVALSLGNPGADLVSLYSANWFNRSDVLWSVSGGNTSSSTANGGDPARTLYYSNGAGGAAWNAQGFSGQAGPNSDMQSQWLRYIQTPTGGDQNSTANSPVGLIQSDSGNNSYGTFQVEGNQTAAYSAFAGGGEADFGDGVAGARLDLFRLPVQADSQGRPGTLLGTFSINQLGQMTFTAVPEPSVIALLGLGAIGLIAYGARRRAQRNTAA
ncbi:MAG: PEP-CTERM sorting domain-containing protein [Chthoniobacterales bacterium]